MIYNKFHSGIWMLPLLLKIIIHHQTHLEIAIKIKNKKSKRTQKNNLYKYCKMKALNKLKTPESQEIEQTDVPKLFENLYP